MADHNEHSTFYTVDFLSIFLSVCGVCMHVCMYMGMYVCKHVCRGQKWPLAVLPLASY